MRTLVLGGTSFVGRAIVEQALSRGDDVTLFSRGRTGTALFPDVPRLVGDRDSGDLAALAGTSWDALIDVSAYVPRHVQQASAAVSADRYLLISTGSVYDHTASPAVVDEDAPRLAPERGTEEHDGPAYGPLKAPSTSAVGRRLRPPAASRTWRGCSGWAGCWTGARSG